MNPTKTAAPLEMPLRVWTRMGPRNHVLDGGPDPPYKGAILSGRQPIIKLWGLSAVSCGKTVELSEMPFGMWTH